MAAEDKLAKIRRLEKIAKIRELEAASERASPEEKAEVEQARRFDRPLEAAAKAGSNVLTLGYLPEIEAGTEQLVGKLSDMYHGFDSSKFNVKGAGYDEALARNRAEQAKLAEYNPKASVAGTVSGALVQAPMMAAGLAKAGIGAGGGLLARTAKSAGVGAGLGAVQNPGELAEDDDQVNARLRQAVTGGLFGAGGEIIGSGLGAGFKKLGELPGKMKSAASGKAIKSAGGMLKDYRRLLGKNRVEEVGEFALKEGYVRPGDTFEDIAQRTTEALNKTGQEIGEIYQNTKPVVQNKEDLVSSLTKAINKEAPKIGRDAYTAKMKDVIEEIANDPDVLAGNPQKINEVIKSLDERINWQKKAQDLPENQAGFLSLRRALRDKANEIVDATGETALKSKNKQYQNLSELNTMSTDRVARENANAMFGLRDTGIGVGTGMLAADDFDPESLTKAGLLGFGAALASKGARSYGNPVLAKGLLKGSGVIDDVLANARGLLPDEVRQAVSKGLIDPRSQFLQSMQVNKNKK